jgi:hypothetical protein
MYRLDPAGSVALWSQRFGYNPGSLREEVYVADDGSFCVMGAILKKNGIVHVPTQSGSTTNGPPPTLFMNSENTFWEVDRMGGEPIVRLWNRDEDQWHAVNVNSENIIEPTPALIAQWNESARRGVFERIKRAQAEATRQRVEAEYPKLGVAAEKLMGARRPARVAEIDCEFLALHGKPEDRPLLEGLLRGDKSLPLGDGEIVMSQVIRMESYDPYFYLHEDRWRVLGDRLLAVFHKKITEKKPYEASGHDLFYLGVIRGSVRLPTPIQKEAGRIRIHLVAADRAQRNWIKDQTESIEQDIEFVTHQQWDLSDEIRFAFTGVSPGLYVIKAIWDKRAPFTDREGAGPGDYESDWSAPFEVTAGGVVTNGPLACVKRGTAAGTYYAADELAAREWKEGDGVSLLSKGPSMDGRHEIFSAPGARWIVGTNFEAPGKKFELARGLMLSWPTPPAGALPPARPQSKSAKPVFPEALTFVWRMGARADGTLRSEPAMVRILDEHGCPYAPGELTTNGSTMAAQFGRFPRANSTFRLAGYGGPGTNELLFDYTLTNHVRSDAKTGEVRALPIDMTFNKVTMHVEKITDFETTLPIPRNPTLGRIFGSLKYDGFATDQYSMYSVLFSDRHGNIIDPEKVCAEEKTTRVIGFIEPRRSANEIMSGRGGERIQYEFFIPRVKPSGPEVP